MAELALTRADLDDLVTARRVTLRRATALSAGTVLVLPLLLSLWGPLFFTLTVVWVAAVASRWGRYIILSAQLATRTMELEALLDGVEQRVKTQRGPQGSLPRGPRVRPRTFSSGGLRPSSG
jgi:Flp pilus assembly protein TadB